MSFFKLHSQVEENMRQAKRRYLTGIASKCP